ncbi:hypothetical protein D3C80_1545540 [compost metagenome]
MGGVAVRRSIIIVPSILQVCDQRCVNGTFHGEPQVSDGFHEPSRISCGIRIDFPVVVNFNSDSPVHQYNLFQAYLF